MSLEKTVKTLFVLAALWAVTLAADFGGGWRQDWASVHDSLRDIEPWLRPRWLAARGLSDYYAAHSWKPAADSGLACIGRWSYGPSARVSLRVTDTDTIICLTRGSGASLIRFRSHDSLTLDLLSDIDCSGITSRAILQDTLVFCGMWQGGTGIEVWGASNLRSPHRLSYVYLPPVKDIAVRDTLLYAVSFQGDSLRVFDVADPRSPIQVGACANPGIYMYGIQVSGDYCYVADQNGLFIVDVSIPQSPHVAGTIGGFDAFAVAVRDTLCYLGTQSSTTFALKVYNVKDPATPFPVGSLTGIEAHDLYLPPTCETIIYTPKLHVINIANPASPRQVGFVDCPGWDYGVAAVPALNYVLVADYFKGMVAVNVTNPTAPALDTMAFAGHEAVDISIHNGRAYLASYHAGLQILDVSNPTRPSYLGCYDTAGASKNVASVTARDSFAFASWNAPKMLSIDVTDPRHPLRAAACSGMSNPPEDMVVRDSLVYVAEIARLQIVNVARPREPVLVGSCGGDGVAIVVQDTFAYTAAGAIRITNIARPDSPFVVSTIAGHSATGLAVNDTFLYVPYVCDTLLTYSVANPAQPRLLSAVQTGVWPWDVTLGESTAYVALSDGYGVEVFDLIDPGRPVRRGRASAPGDVRRLCYGNGLLYAAMWEAGVAIYETTATAVGETDAAGPRRPEIRVWPSVATDCVRFSADRTTRELDIAVFDISGMRLGNVIVQAETKGGATQGRIGFVGLPAGVYVVRVSSEATNLTAKVVRTKGR